MDKHGNRIENEAQVAELLAALSEQESDNPPKKITMQAYFASPEFQRRAKIAKEAVERAKFEARMSLKQAQDLNPIKPRPRKKRGRKKKE